MNSEIKHFNIRVYALILKDGQHVLLSDEFVLDTPMTKFPGGGLKFGEGPEDCIKRECLEEFGQEVTIRKHFYTTGFYQRALFYPDHQLISIYYLVDFKEKPGFRISTIPFDFEPRINGSQSFRWVNFRELDEKELTFPIDRHVLILLRGDL